MSLPRWSESFQLSQFDLRAVFAEAAAQKKSAYEVLKDAGYPVFKFFGDGQVLTKGPFLDEAESKAAFGDDTPNTIKLIASTNALDLVGHSFEESAMRTMEAAAPGTTVFLNH